MAGSLDASGRRAGRPRLDTALVVLAWTGVAVGFAVWLWLLPHFAVDVPIMDQWDTPAHQIIAFWEGRLDWDLLTSQHNDSRRLYLNALSVALAALAGGYRPGAEVFITLALGAVITGGFALLARRTGLGALGAAGLAALYAGLSLAPRTDHPPAQLELPGNMADAMLVLALLR